MNEVNEVFEYWKERMGHERARMDAARLKVIRARLADGYEVADLCLAIDGCAASAFHMGENDRGQRYDSITLILRDADHVDKFVRAGETAHRIALEKQEKIKNAAKMQSTPATEEQKQKVREILSTVKLKRIA